MGEGDVCSVRGVRVVEAAHACFGFVVLVFPLLVTDCMGFD